MNFCDSRLLFLIHSNNDMNGLLSSILLLCFHNFFKALYILSISSGRQFSLEKTCFSMVMPSSVQRMIMISFNSYIYIIYVRGVKLLDDGIICLFFFCKT